MARSKSLVPAPMSGTVAGFRRTAPSLVLWMALAMVNTPARGVGPESGRDRRNESQATTPAERLRAEVTGHLAAGRIEGALEAAQRAIAAYPKDVDVRDEFVALHLSLARRAMADESFDLAERALSAVLRIDREEPQARELLSRILMGRNSVPRRLAEARRWLELEWFEPAFVAFRQATALESQRSAEWHADYIAAAIGAGDDNYVTKNFHDAFYYYDAAIRLTEQGDRPPEPALVLRWAQSLTHALSRDVDRAAYPPDFWRLVLSRAARLSDGSDAAAADSGVAGLRSLLRGLAYDNLGDSRRATAEYGRYLGATGYVPEDLRNLRSRAVRRLREMYDVSLCSRRVGPWTRGVAGEWEVLESAGFRIHHQNEFVAARVAAAAEFHLERILDLLSLDADEVPWPIPCEVYLHANDREFRTATRQGIGVRGVSVINARGGRLVSHEIHLIQSDPLLLSASLSHEIAHLIVGAATQYQEMPGAVSEGLALQIEPQCRKRQFARLFSEMRKPPSLTGLLKERRAHPPESAFYSAAFRLSELLRSERGLRGILEIAGKEWKVDELARRMGFQGLQDLESRYLGLPQRPERRR